MSPCLTGPTAGLIDSILDGPVEPGSAFCTCCPPTDDRILRRSGHVDGRRPWTVTPIFGLNLSNRAGPLG
jgi:hypothetical protein